MTSSEAIFKCDVRFDGISSCVSCNWTKCSEFEYACVQIIFEDFFVIDNSNFKLFLIHTFLNEFSIFSYMDYFCGVSVMFWSLTDPILINFYCIGNIQDIMQNIFLCVSLKTENLLLRVEMALG